MSARNRLGLISSLVIALASVALAEPIRIMPLGDSITQGDRWHNSYRRPLWFKLKAAGYEVDFVGSLRSHRWGGPPNADFDLDHEGHWGWRADQILARLHEWAAAARPDIVLVHLGSNDLFQGQKNETTVSEIRGIIQSLRETNPSVHVLVAQIIGSSGANAETSELNRLIAGLAALSTETSRVIIVDQWTGFDPAADTYDGTHPNAAGEEKIATRWFGALQSVLPTTP